MEALSTNVHTLNVNDSQNVGLDASTTQNDHRLKKKSRAWQDLSTFPSKLPGDQIGAGDSFISYEFLEDSHEIFVDILNEVKWQTMSHATGEVPRLVCCQGDIDLRDGSMPVYRHPSDFSLPLLKWDNSVIKVKKAATEIIGHPLNHVLIQLYRGGTDFISEHSDKTLDVVPGSKIVNVSFGAQRTMRLRSKRTRVVESMDDINTRITERIHLPHNSIFVMGLKTNEQFLHGIQPDKRSHQDLNDVETAYGGFRISLTFRYIGTYLSYDSKLIWGIGATSKDLSTAHPTINCAKETSDEMLHAFGIENQSTNFARQSIYGNGFDVLHLNQFPSQTNGLCDIRMLFMSGLKEQDERVLSKLKEYNLVTKIINRPDLLNLGLVKNSVGQIISIIKSEDQCVTFRDVDQLHSTIQKTDEICKYLDRTYGPIITSQLPTPSTSHVSYDRVYEPAEDSFLLLDTLSSPEETQFLHEQFSKGNSPLILEVGVGSGVVLAFMVANAGIIIGRTDILPFGTDLNPFACNSAIQTIIKNADNTFNNMGTIFNADLATPFRSNQVDILIFNPPYVPAPLPRFTSFDNTGQKPSFEQDSYLLELSYAGGEDGMEVTNRLIEDLPRILSQTGVAYILFCKQNRPQEVISRIKSWNDNKWNAKIVGESGKKAGWEKLSIVRIWRSF